MTRMTAASRAGAMALVLSLAAACTSTAATRSAPRLPRPAPVPHHAPAGRDQPAGPPGHAAGGGAAARWPARPGGRAVLAALAAAARHQAAELRGRIRVAGMHGPVRGHRQALLRRRGCHGDAVRRAALCNRARRHREVPEAHRDRRRGRRDRPRHLHVPRHPLVTQLHGPAPGPALPLCPQARGRVPERAARAAHRLHPGVLPGEPAALQRGERPGVAELPG